MASLRYSKVNVENEAAILSDGVKRVYGYGRLKECMTVCSVTGFNQLIGGRGKIPLNDMAR